MTDRNDPASSNGPEPLVETGDVGAAASVSDLAAEASGAASPSPAAPQKSFVRRMLGQWPLGIVLLGVVVGLAIVATGHWRLGSTGVGAAITVGGLLRALPVVQPGLLAVRRRPLDVAVLLGVGIGIIVFAWVVPPQRG